MYTIQTYQDQYEIYKLSSPDGSSWLEICPERGGIAIGYGVSGQEMFYLDKSTFYDPQANIRGGNPVLFPISGQLQGGQYEWNGTVYTMKNHGVARVLPWTVVGTESSAESASITLSLGSNEETLASYPFEFELIFTYELRDGGLHIHQHYRNDSGEPMPMYPGFHPYFKTESKVISFHSDATKILDYNDMETKPFTGKLDLDTTVESVTLLDARKPQISFDLPELGRSITLSYDEHFPYVVLWSVQGKPFVCVEPWMAKTQELNVKQELTMVEPGETLKTTLSITCEMMTSK